MIINDNKVTFQCCHMLLKRAFTEEHFKVLILVLVCSSRVKGWLQYTHLQMACGNWALETEYKCNFVLKKISVWWVETRRPSLPTKKFSCLKRVSRQTSVEITSFFHVKIRLSPPIGKSTIRKDWRRIRQIS
jgi:hypothetical protein